MKPACTKHLSNSQKWVFIVCTHLPLVLVGCLLLLYYRMTILGSFVIALSIISIVYHSLQTWKDHYHKATIGCSWFDTGMGCLMLILFIAFYVEPPYIWVLAGLVVCTLIVPWVCVHYDSPNAKTIYPLWHRAWHILAALWVWLAAISYERVQWSVLEPT